jgi:hypothetical protein
LLCCKAGRSRLTKRKNPVKVEKDLDGVKKDVARIKFITCELHGYVYRDEMPVA